jgi:membrane protease YdiL (CAAX protease family)
MRSPTFPVGPGTAAAMVVAQGAIAASFRGPRDRFWSRMTWTGFALGLMALAGSRSARRARIGRRETALGLASAGVLYATFRTGDTVVRRFVPGGDAQIRDLYRLRMLRPALEVAARLAIVGPAEELFWRGLVQESMARRSGRWTGAGLAAVAYGSAHIATGNLVLVGAAGVAGAFWCTLYAAEVPLGALVVSHIAWDLWIFLLQPTGEIGPTRPPANPDGA